MVGRGLVGPREYRVPPKPSRLPLRGATSRGGEHLGLLGDVNVDIGPAKDGPLEEVPRIAIAGLNNPEPALNPPPARCLDFVERGYATGEGLRGNSLLETPLGEPSRSEQPQMSRFSGQALAIGQSAVLARLLAVC